MTRLISSFFSLSPLLLLLFNCFKMIFRICYFSPIEHLSTLKTVFLDEDYALEILFAKNTRGANLSKGARSDFRIFTSVAFISLLLSGILIALFGDDTTLQTVCFFSSPMESLARKVIFAQIFSVSQTLLETKGINSHKNSTSRSDFSRW